MKLNGLGSSEKPYLDTKKNVKMRQQQSTEAENIPIPFWDRLSMGTEFLGTVCPGGPEVWGQEVRGQEVRGPNWLGTVCPVGPNFWGPFVQRDQIGRGSFVQGDQIFRDQMSMGTGSGGPEVRGSNGLGTILRFGSIKKD